jgi:acetyl esterase
MTDLTNRLSTYVTPSEPNTFVRARRKTGAVLVARFFKRAASLGARLPSAAPDRHGVEVMHDLPYLMSGLSDHTLDVYRPVERNGLRPVVMYVHGGAFWSLSKDTHWLMGLVFARRGFVVANVNYRLAPKHRFPAGLEDVAEAFRFVRDHAEEWGGDPSRIVLAGESAGANLITSLALARAYERTEPFAKVARAVDVDPQAILAACGVFHVTGLVDRVREKHNLNWFMNDRYAELEHMYPQWREGKPVLHDLIDPVLLLEREAPKKKLPPFFLPVGGRDHLRYDNERMEIALKNHGVDVEARVYDGEWHAFHAFVLSKNAKQCWRDHFDFLEKRGIPVDRRLP